MMSKIQNLNGTHNVVALDKALQAVVYDVKDTKFDYILESTEYRLQSAVYRVVPYAKIIPTVAQVG